MAAIFRKEYFFEPSRITIIKPGCVAHFGALSAIRHSAISFTKCSFLQYNFEIQNLIFKYQSS